MKISFYKRDMLDVLRLVSRSVAVKPMTPILSGIYLRTQGNQLELQSNDMSTGTIARIPISCERDGVTAVDGKKFHEIIAKLPDDTATAELSGNQLVIVSGAARFELMTYTPEDFPQVKKPEGQTVPLKADLLKEIIVKTSYAVSKDGARPVFQAVNIEIGGGQIKATSTNGHRLAYFKTAMPTGDEVKANIPAAALKNLAIVLPDDETPVEMILGDRYVAFAFEDYLMTARLTEGDFPPIEKLLEPKDGIKVRVNRLELRSVLDRVGIVSKSTDYNTVKLLFEPGALTVLARTESTTAQEALEVESTGDLAISFNATYFGEYLTSTASEWLTLQFGNEIEPVLISGEGDENYIALITPVRA